MDEAAALQHCLLIVPICFHGDRDGFYELLEALCPIPWIQHVLGSAN